MQLCACVSRMRARARCAHSSSPMFQLFFLRLPLHCVRGSANSVSVLGETGNNLPAPRTQYILIRVSATACTRALLFAVCWCWDADTGPRTVSHILECLRFGSNDFAMIYPHNLNHRSAFSCGYFAIGRLPISQISRARILLGWPRVEPRYAECHKLK